jgi:hypothetical protein
MGVEKTRGERGDSPDAKGKILPYLEHANTPEAGMLSLNNGNHRVVLFYSVIL